jgi:hypothetical protein
MALSSWSEVQAHLRSRYRLQQDDAQSFLLGFAFESGAAPAASLLPGSEEPLVQGIQGQPVTVDGHAFLLLRAEVCSDRAMSPTAALQHSAKLVLGALVLSGNHYVLRYSAPLSSLEAADLDYALEYLAREAATTRTRAAQQVVSPEPRGRVPHWSE